jgi:undecaprenyl-diphosphatase
MVFITVPENFALAAVVAALFLLTTCGNRGKRLVVSLLLGVGVSDPLSSFGIKSLVARPRPCHGVISDHLLKGCSDSWSFPSSHAVNIFCAATILSRVFPKAAVPAYVFAAAVGYSRVYIGVHYPLDVIGGAVIGTLLGFLVSWTVLKFWDRFSFLSQRG